MVQVRERHLKVPYLYGEQHMPIKITEQLAHIHQLNNLELAQNGNYTLLVTIIAIIYSGSN